MINKIFLALFGVEILTMATLTLLANSQLKSHGFAPAQIVQNFSYYENWHWLTLWISSIILLILANVILWTSRKSWALWLTFLFFVGFILVNTWWLTENVANYQKDNYLDTAGLLSKNGIFGVILGVAAGIGIFFNQFIVLRLRDKMFEKPTEQVETVSAEKPAEDSAEKSAEETNSKDSTSD